MDGNGCLNLIMDNLWIHRHEPMSPTIGRVEGDDARQGRAPEHPELMKSLEVSLGSSATGRLGASNSQCNLRHVSKSKRLDGANVRIQER